MPDAAPLAPQGMPAVKAPARRGQAAITPPAPSALAAREDAPASALLVEPAASEPIAPRPLNLTLPRRSADLNATPPDGVAEALREARTNNRRGGPWERLPSALGTDRTLTEERLQDGTSVRLRRGVDCVIVSQSRESQLDPFNQSVNPSARGVAPCR